MKNITIISCCCAAALLLLPGCGNGDVKSYKVAKSAPTPEDPHKGHNHASPHGQMSAPATLKYTKPEKWTEAEPGEMRAASFRVTEGSDTADVGVFPLPGMAGGDLGNVNRWRGQVGLEPLKEEDLTKASEEVAVGEAKGQLYDLAGTTPGSEEKTRILAAIHRRDGMAWFFKMTGPDALVAAQKPDFIAFLKSVQFTEAKVEGLPPSHPPIDASSMASAPAATATGGSSADKPQWTVPSGWKEAPAGQFLAAKFVAAGDDGAEAAINVSVSSGEGGGVAGNVNRWRGQLGLETLPPEQLKLEKVATDGGEATLADLTGKDGRTGKSARLIGVIVPQTGKTWFYKLMGDEKIVEREKDAFIQFLKTAKY